MNNHEIFSIVMAILLGIGLIYFGLQNLKSLNEQKK